jgi:hypothetical protein
MIMSSVLLLKYHHCFLHYKHRTWHHHNSHPHYHLPLKTMVFVSLDRQAFAAVRARPADVSISPYQPHARPPWQAPHGCRPLHWWPPGTLVEATRRGLEYYRSGRGWHSEFCKILIDFILISADKFIRIYCRILRYLPGGCLAGSHCQAADMTSENPPSQSLLSGPRRLTDLSTMCFFAFASVDNSGKKAALLATRGAPRPTNFLLTFVQLASAVLSALASPNRHCIHSLDGSDDMIA